jgi:hypothetical protein
VKVTWDPTVGEDVALTEGCCRSGGSKKAAMGWWRWCACDSCQSDVSMHTSGADASSTRNWALLVFWLLQPHRQQLSVNDSGGAHIEVD